MFHIHLNCGQSTYNCMFRLWEPLPRPRNLASTSWCLEHVSLDHTHLLTIMCRKLLINSMHDETVLTRPFFTLCRYSQLKGYVFSRTCLCVYVFLCVFVCGPLTASAQWAQGMCSVELEMRLMYTHHVCICLIYLCNTYRKIKATATGYISHVYTPLWQWIPTASIININPTSGVARNIWVPRQFVLREKILVINIHNWRHFTCSGV